MRDIKILRDVDESCFYYSFLRSVLFVLIFNFFLNTSTFLPLNIYIYTAFWLFKQRAGWLLKDPRHVPDDDDDDDDYVRGDGCFGHVNNPLISYYIRIVCRARKCLRIIRYTYKYTC